MRTIKIGTRNSPLAMWQAHEVERLLNENNYATEIVPIVSSGDKNLTQPLYALGITGVFTKDLDIALINGDIDIAVHSLKDVPTLLPNNIVLSAVLERDFPEDVLVRRSEAKDKDIKDLKVATSSLRRRAFWSNQFAETEFADIRGNVQTRLKKLEDGVADATLFSLAGIKRMNLDLDFEYLDFMIQAPSQGVVTIANREDDQEITDLLKNINHQDTAICVHIEREFLRTLEGGCTAPIGAIAKKDGNTIHFQGRLCSLDGVTKLEIEETFTYEEGKNYGEIFAGKILNEGGKALMEEIKSQI